MAVEGNIWREGEWLDLWSLVHLCSGSLFGLGFALLALAPTLAVAITLISLIVYEVFEILVKIEETPINRVMDVVVGMSSFTIFFFWGGPQMSTTAQALAFGALSALTATLSTMGWREAQKVEALKTKLRERYRHEREQLQHDREVLRRRFHHYHKKQK